MGLDPPRLSGDRKPTQINRLMHERMHPKLLYLDRVLVGEEVDDFQGVLDDASRHQLLTAVAPLAHEGHAEALHDRALFSGEKSCQSAKYS